MEIFDNFCWEDHKKVITSEEHGIPGLGNFAHWNMAHATPATPDHHHSDIVEIHCLAKGKRLSVVNGEVFTVTGNEMLVTFPYESHHNGSYNLSPCTFYGLQINIKDPEHILGLNREFSLAIHRILINLEHRHLRFTSGDQQLLKQAFENISDGDPDALKLGVQFLSCFLFKIPEFIPVREEEEKKIKDANIERVLEYIERSYKESLLLKELAVISGYSLSRFKSKFKEEVGLTPANYITFKKLEYAKHLLRTTELTVTQIALDAGFSSSNYFSTVLRNQSSYSPSEFRRVSREMLPND